MELDKIIGYFQAVAEAFEGNCPVTPTEDEYAMIAAIPWLRKAKEMEEWSEDPVCPQCHKELTLWNDSWGDGLTVAAYCNSCLKDVDILTLYKVEST